MKPIKFKHSNKILLPSGKEYSDNVIGVEPFPMWTDGESALIFGRIWLALLSGEAQCPAYLSASRSYFKDITNES